MSWLHPPGMILSQAQSRKSQPDSEQLGLPYLGILGYGCHVHSLPVEKNQPATRMLRSTVHGLSREAYPQDPTSHAHAHVQMQATTHTRASMWYQTGEPPYTEPVLFWLSNSPPGKRKRGFCLICQCSWSLLSSCEIPCTDILHR